MAPLTGQTFIFKAGGGVELTLHEAVLLGHKSPIAERELFSLVFRGAQGLRLPLATYAVSQVTL